MIGTSLRVYQSRAFFERNRAAPLDNPAKQFDFIGVLVTIATILAILPHLPPTPVDPRWKLNIESSKVDFLKSYIL